MIDPLPMNYTINATVDNEIFILSSSGSQVILKYQFNKFLIFFCILVMANNYSSWYF